MKISKDIIDAALRGEQAKVRDLIRNLEDGEIVRLAVAGGIVEESARDIRKERRRNKRKGK